MTRTNELQRQTQARNRREGEKWMRRRAEMEGEARRRKHAERLSQLSVSAEERKGGREVCVCMRA